MNDEQRKAMFAKQGSKGHGISSGIRAKNLESDFDWSKYKRDVDQYGFLRSDRVYKISDIDDGKQVVRKMQEIIKRDHPNYSIETRLHDEGDEVQMGILDTLGRDNERIMPFIDYRLSGKHDGKHWIFAIPLTYDGKDGSLGCEDTGGFVTDAYKHKARLTSVDPKVFLNDWCSPNNFESVNSRKVIERIKQALRDGKPVETPYIYVDPKTGRVISHEGRHRAESAIELGIDQIPVEVVSYTPIDSMTQSERNRFFSDKYLRQNS